MELDELVLIHSEFIYLLFILDNKEMRVYKINF